MRMNGFFNSESLRRSNKRKAIKNVMDKLDKTKAKLEKKLRAESSKAKIKSLEFSLKTNKQQQKKANRLLAELD